MRLFEKGPMTRKQIFEGTKYGKYRPGLLSTCFTDLIEKDLIGIDNGYMKPYTVASFFGRKNTAWRAVAYKRGEAPIYKITQGGIDLINKKSAEEVVL